ncbi:hypothetical protein VNO78_16321 [Psophocarpus tetragonolobus]|uniref:CCT domain-containing protein n=1 Tax=Psophocarpus tetragonolobus TaxID=3891 RepID=A0AAN9SFM4_PSOTE
MCKCNKSIASSSSSEIQTQTMKRIRKPNRRYSNSSCSSSSSCSSLKPHRRGNRTKTRKPKFVSLSLQLAEPGKPEAQPASKPKAQHHQTQQLNLFPLHPDHHDMHEDHNVALLFTSDAAATLHGLLEDQGRSKGLSECWSDRVEDDSTTGTTEVSVLTCPAEEEEGNWLVRKAMRRRESEEGSEERWVCYSEVVEEKKEAMEEVTSYCVATTEKSNNNNNNNTVSFGLLSLKLDHQGILNAWSDKGSLYVAGEGAPLPVPDFFNGLLFNNAVTWNGWGSGFVGNTWSNVPEDCGANKENVKEETGWKLGQREASVQRYKEKRQSRLFSKKIRYEVRKVNAEKRPRMKGRFVKSE